jgi:hypothetical protein
MEGGKSVGVSEAVFVGGKVAAGGGSSVDEPGDTQAVSKPVKKSRRAAHRRIFEIPLQEVSGYIDQAYMGMDGV